MRSVRATRRDWSTSWTSISGDDLTGDIGGDDALDNKIISVHLDRLDPQADQVVFVLNSFKGQDFATRGEPTVDNKLEQTLKTVVRKYL
jgi:stress response protein SCP2